VRIVLGKIWKILFVFLPSLLGQGESLFVRLEVMVQELGNPGLDVREGIKGSEYLKGCAGYG